MSAPDFYFAVNDIFHHIHDNYGKDVLIDYWRKLGQEHYRQRNAAWKQGGAPAIAKDWRAYFDKEPCAEVEITHTQESVDMDIKVCPSILHLRKNEREIAPYFCEHCDHICGAQAEAAGFKFERTGGMGSCQQRFVKLTTGAA